MGWRSLTDMVTTPEDSGSGDTDGMEWLNESFYEQNHTISNLEYTQLKLSKFAIKLHSTWTNNNSIWYWSYLFMHISTNIHENFRQSQYDQETFKSGVVLKELH